MNYSISAPESRPPATRPRVARRAIVAILLVVVGALGFKLFEPLLTHNFGWQALPQDVDSHIVQALSQPEWTAASEAAQASLTRARRSLQAPALSVAIGVDGAIVWQSAIGYADVERREPIALDSRFRLGSTSKALTSMALGTLIEANKIALDAPIQRYIPTFPQKPWPISLRQIASHQAGIRDYGLCLCLPIWEHLNTRHFGSVAESVARVADADLRFEPGTRYAYTSLGYNLVGAAIENASGMEFGTYMQSAVWQPLAMERTALDSSAGADLDRVGFYEVENGKFKRAFAVDNSIRWPAGGMLSTPGDLVRMGNALLGDQLFSAATRQILTTVHKPASDQPVNYALGWRHSQRWKLADGQRTTETLHHAGTAVGSTSVFVLYPEFHLVISLMMNKGGSDTDALSELADALVAPFIARRLAPK